MIIECRALSSDKVLIRYRNTTENPDEEKEVPMRRMTGGIFTKAFIMFSGEILRYRTVIIRGGERIEGPEEACVMTSVEQGGKSCYQRINRMIAEKKNGNYDAFRDAERKYRLAVHVVQELFPLQSDGSAAKEDES